MTERRRIKGDPRLGFHVNELEGEVCVECGRQAEFAVESPTGLVHYCAEDLPQINAKQTTKGTG